VRASYEPTELAPLTAEIASTFRSAMESAGLQLIVECAPLPEPIYVDREMWEKVVLNLLSNALKYTFQGKVTVRLDQNDGRAVLSVADTGTGIPEHEVPKLFERFHRVEGARGRTQEGTGIGLALVGELIKLHGGKIEVQSALGAGSTFTVSLPLGAAHLPPERLQPARALAAAAASADTYVDEAARWVSGRHTIARSDGGPATRRASGGRVLVADDNADMRDYVSRLLAEHYDVEAVANGEEALVCALNDPPDLVLSDVMMPGLDGFGLLQALRKNAATSAMPVILLSARAGEEARVEGLAAGATDYLVKPFTARDLLARVDSQIEMARIRNQAARREETLRAEAQAERDRAVGILESITDGFFTLDRDWCFTYVNPAGEQLLRARQGELLGKNHWELYPGAIGTNGEREYRRAARDGVPVVSSFITNPGSIGTPSTRTRLNRVGSPSTSAMSPSPSGLRSSCGSSGRPSIPLFRSPPITSTQSIWKGGSLTRTVRPLPFCGRHWTAFWARASTNSAFRPRSPRSFTARFVKSTRRENPCETTPRSLVPRGRPVTTSTFSCRCWGPADASKQWLAPRAISPTGSASKRRWRPVKRNCGRSLRKPR
jgi:CheY-like chemotaxis protein